MSIEKAEIRHCVICGAPYRVTEKDNDLCPICDDSMLLTEEIDS